MDSRPTEPAEVGKAPAGAAIGPYVRVKLLGEGGFGQVWKAWDRTIGRWVAIKVMKGSGDERRARFEREARLAATLDHPNITRIYAVGEHDGQLYLALQYIDGMTLRRWPLGGRDAARAIRDAARALQAAHDRGVIHRDLKPENLMIDGSGHVYIMDFGLARDVDGVTLTASGAAVGTPAYMPPEQARGESADARSDVYSLGATLYELLTGRNVFEGSNAIDILMAVISEDPMAPRRLRPEIDPALEAVVLKCLEKEPAARYGSATALADDLDRCLRGDATAAKPRSIRQKVGRAARRQSWLIAITAAIVLVAVGGFALLRRGTGQVVSAREEQLRSLRAMAASCLDAALDMRRAGNEAGMDEHAHRLEEACRQLFDLPETKFILGRLRRAQMRDAEALALQDEALRGDPTLGAARYERVVLTARKLRARMEEVRDRAYRDSRLQSGEQLDAVFARAEREVDQDEGVKALRSQIARDLAAFERIEIGRGERLCAEGFRAWERPSEALAKFRDAVAAERRLEEAHESIASLLIAERRYEESLSAWTEGIENDRGYRPFLEGRIRSVLAYGEEAPAERARIYEMAERDATELIRRRPGEARYRVLRAEVRSVRILHGRDDLYAAAMEDLAEALRLAPRGAEALRQRGALTSNRATRDLGLTAECLALTQEAEADFNRALEIEPDHIDALRWRGITRMNLARFEIEAGRDGRRGMREAADDFSRLVELRPGYLHAWLLRGQARWQLAVEEARRGASGVDTFREAMTDLETATRLLPDYAEAYGEMALAMASWAPVLVRRGTDERSALEGAEEAARTAVKLAPRDGKMRLLLGQVRAQTARSAISRGGDGSSAAREAVAAFNEALRLGADQPIVWYERAQARQMLGRFEEAELDFGEALKRAPSWAECLVRRSEMRWRWAQGSDADAKKLLRSAQQDCEKAVALAPSMADAWHWLGLVRDSQSYLSGEDPIAHQRAAAEAYEKAVALVPSSARYWTFLGGTRANLGLYLARAGEPPLESWGSAIEALDQSLKLDEKDVTTWLFRGNAFIGRADYLAGRGEGGRDDYAEAQRCFERVGELSPGMRESLRDALERCRRGMK